MFAEFEREIHARVDKGEPLTGEALTKIYGEILAATTAMPRAWSRSTTSTRVEWAYIPHFYNAFYVFQYATSIAASSLFARRDPRGQSPARASATSKLLSRRAAPTTPTSW